MSPEQMDSARDVDLRTDVWAMGVTLHELVMGSPPFGGASLVQVYSRMTSGDAPWRAAVKREVPGLEEVLSPCLAPDRDHRYANVDELARAIREFQARRNAGAPDAVADAAPISESNPGVVTQTMGQRGPSRPARNLLAATLAGFLGGAALLFVARPPPAEDLPSSSRSPSSPADPTDTGQELATSAMPAAAPVPSANPAIPGSSQPVAADPVILSSAVPGSTSPPHTRTVVHAASMAPAPSFTQPTSGLEPERDPSPVATASSGASLPPSARFTAEQVKSMLNRRE
jgi:serine/threonine-protein kinase